MNTNVDKWSAAELLSQLKRRGVFSAIAGYAVVCFIILQIADATFEPLGIGPFYVQAIVTIAILGFPIVGYVSWTFDFSLNGGFQRADVTHSKTVGLMASLLFIMALLIASLSWQSAPATYTTLKPAGNNPAFPLPDKPSIAVLPFRTIGADRDQRFIADGVTDDLITDLSQIASLFVIGHQSVFGLKNRDIAPIEAARQFGVRYVLQGSIQQVDQQLRVNAQLIDTVANNSIWAERFIGEFSSAFELQDQVADTVVRELQLALTDQIPENAEFRAVSNTAARHEFQRGWQLYRENTPRTFALAIEHFDAAIELDESFYRAYAARAAVFQAALSRDFTVRIGEWTRSLGLKPDDVMRNLLFNLQAAEAEESPFILQIRAQLNLWRNRFDEAKTDATKAIALAPNDPLGHEVLSAIETLSGNPLAGLSAIETAMRLDPAYPDEYLFWKGLALFSAEDYQAAGETLELARELNRGDDRVLIMLTAAYGHLQRATDARRSLAELDALQSRRKDERADAAPGDILVGIDVQLEGRYTLTEVDLWPFRERVDRERLRRGLKLAGLQPMGPEDNQIPLSVAGAKTVSIDEALELFERDVLIVDVRGLADRNIGYIPGSVFLNLQTRLSRASLLAAADPDQEVLFHCEGMR